MTDSAGPYARTCRCGPGGCAGCAPHPGRARPPARLLLTLEYRRDRVALSVYLAGQLFDATADLIALNPTSAPSPAELFDRFLAWTARTPM